MWADGTSYAPILHFYQRYNADNFQAFYFDFGESERFTAVAVLSDDAATTSYMTGFDGSYDSTVTSFALLSEKKILTVKATFDASTSTYSLVI